MTRGLVFVFYKINKITNNSHHSMQERLINLYNKILTITTGCVYDHVGISIVHVVDNKLSLEPFDLSAWSGRESGPTLLCLDKSQDKKNHFISASHAYLLTNIPDVLVDKLKNQFSTYNKNTHVRNGMGCAGVEYPSFRKMCSDWLRHKLPVPNFTFLHDDIDEKNKKIDKMLNSMYEYSTCTQITTLTIYDLIRQGVLKHDRSMYSNFYKNILYRGASLHPNTLDNFLQGLNITRIDATHSISIIDAYTSSTSSNGTLSMLSTVDPSIIYLQDFSI